jgi:hypothetical protein
MIRELIDSEVEMVAGGFNLTAITQKLNQKNDVHQDAFAFAYKGDATAVNALGSVSNTGINNVG